MSPRALTQAEDAEAAFILAHPYDHPADEVDRAERHLAHNAEHVLRRAAIATATISPSLAPVTAMTERAPETYGSVGAKEAHPQPREAVR